MINMATFFFIPLVEKKMCGCIWWDWEASDLDLEITEVIVKIKKPLDAHTSIQLNREKL